MFGACVIVCYEINSKWLSLAFEKHLTHILKVHPRKISVKSENLESSLKMLAMAETLKTFIS